MSRAVFGQLVLAGVLLCAVSPHAQVFDRVLATVDGHMVTLSDVRATTTLGLTPAGAMAAATRRWTGGSSGCSCCRKWIASRRRSRPQPRSTSRVAAVLAPLGTPDQAQTTLTHLGIDAGVGAAVGA